MKYKTKQKAMQNCQHCLKCKTECAFDDISIWLSNSNDNAYKVYISMWLYAWISHSMYGKSNGNPGIILSIEPLNEYSAIITFIREHEHIEWQ